MKKWGARRGVLPTLHHLVALEATARLGSFRAAADEMHLTQGAVAQQIRALESELGHPLFERLPRGLVPTPRGADYVARIRLALGIVEEAGREFAGQGLRNTSGRLTLSTTVAFASRWLMPRLPRLAEAHPDISVMVEASEFARSLQGEDRVDMAIRWGKPPFAEGHARFLLAGQAIAVCSPALIEGKPPATPEDLADLPLISDSHGNWKRWLDAYRIPKARIEGPVFSQTALALEAAERGMGVALAAHALIETALKTGALVQALAAPYPLETDLAFYVLTAEPCAPASDMSRVIDWLLHEAGSGS